MMSRALLPKIPSVKNGKRIGLIGAGCASLTVANDLMPLGYQVTIFEQFGEPGGLMRTNIPSFRLPHAVLNEEIAMITGMGVDLKLNHPDQEHARAARHRRLRCSVRRLRRPQGQGAEPAGQRRRPRANIHIGIAWLESVAFGHIEKIGERVLIIGVGNTAMDCCRTSLRLGARQREGHGAQAARVLQGLRLGAGGCRGGKRRDRHQPLAEVLRARERQAHRHAVRQDGVRHGCAAGASPPSASSGEEFLPADDVILAIGQENAFPWIERDLGIEFDKWDVPVVDKDTFQSTRPGVFFGGDAAFGPKNIIWAVEHGHQAAISIHRHCQGEPVTERLAPGVNLQSRKMGMHEWWYSNDYAPVERRLMPHVSLKERFKKLNIEVELGFTAEQVEQEVQRCLNCDVQTVFTAKLCIECDACIDICPVDCLTITHNGDGGGPARDA